MFFLLLFSGPIPHSLKRLYIALIGSIGVGFPQREMFGRSRVYHDVYNFILQRPERQRIREVSPEYAQPVSIGYLERFLIGQ